MKNKLMLIGFTAVLPIVVTLDYFQKKRRIHWFVLFGRTLAFLGMAYTVTFSPPNAR